MSLNKLKQYQQAQNQCGIAAANPHRLIQMLMEGALEKMANAKGFITRNDFANKGAQISWAIKIIGGLKESLDYEKGGEISENLDKLYDFMIFKLSEANIENSVEKIDEAITIMKNIKEGWDGIEEESKAFFESSVRAEYA
ncbi:flagellar export chaperone FliS [Aliikangiella sp. G2MR2-5]|uniref:flagellar export chaperone FliS n=1 Tax=Aliikangiella sp. G2MR2-5 TaxID=2788943 RepID=UPI0018AA6FCA|nr:flagellar export chaperone FliS [Aliikangiella sp. G2MR2-5]